jgi:hypothetical protein
MDIRENEGFIVGVFMIALGISLGSLCFWLNDCILKKASLKELIRNDAVIFKPEQDDKDYYFLKKQKIIRSNSENLYIMEYLTNMEIRPKFNDREDFFERKNFLFQFNIKKFINFNLI